VGLCSINTKNVIIFNRIVEETLCQRRFNQDKFVLAYLGNRGHMLNMEQTKECQLS
jgi:hypothetical protein